MAWSWNGVSYIGIFGFSGWVCMGTRTLWGGQVYYWYENFVGFALYRADGGTPLIFGLFKIIR